MSIESKTKVEIDLSCECGRTHRVSFDNAPADDVVAQVIAGVAKETGVAQKAILGPSQVQRVSRARGIVMARLRDNHGYTYLQCAKAVNRKTWASAKAQCERYKGQ